MKYYAVAHPVQAIYTSWADCEKAVSGQSRARYKSFKNLDDARDFMASGGHGSGGGYYRPVSSSSSSSSSAVAAAASRPAPSAAPIRIPAVMVLPAAAAAAAAAGHKRKQREEVITVDDDDYSDGGAGGRARAPWQQQAARPSASTSRTGAASSASASAAAAAATTATAATMHFDGGSRGNPGPAGCGAVLRDDATGAVVGSRGLYLGTTTNNVAEYRALILGLEMARERGVRTLKVYGDSSLVVNQVTNRWKVKQPHLAPLWARARELASGFHRMTLEYVPRERNADADRLANEAMDARAPLAPPLASGGGGGGGGGQKHHHYKKQRR